MAKKYTFDKKSFSDSEETPAAAEPKPTTGFIGQKMRISQGGHDFEGLCTAHRKINDGEQVYLQLNGCVSRWFDINDVV